MSTFVLTDSGNQLAVAPMIEIKKVNKAILFLFALRLNTEFVGSKFSCWKGTAAIAVHLAYNFSNLLQIGYLKVVIRFVQILNVYGEILI